ncbi:MAG: SEC-C domain-containing protein [Sinobacterium sp.]|nr:SEC-C domain-containing protein [Sinobacterium sp.]
MSDKFFFKGRINKKPKHFSHSFNTKRQIKPGSEEAPIDVWVTHKERAEEISAIAAQHELCVNIIIDADQAENLNALDCIIQTTDTVRIDNTPKRNDPCSCGSELKYKKCCGK